jgi:ZIP family zinc transporter
MTLHHLPEGMAVGLAVTAATTGQDPVAQAGAWTLVAAMAIHNAAEGALVSLPLRREGMTRTAAFLRGQWSGAAEVAGALVGALAATVAVAVLPWGLAAAAGAMGAVILGDLLPELRRTVTGMQARGIPAGT